LDIPTAYEFFGSNPEGTLQKIQATMKKLVSEWNEEHRGKTSVKNVLLIDYTFFSN
jgi:hypothetical protein